MSAAELLGKLRGSRRPGLATPRAGRIGFQGPRRRPAARPLSWRTLWVSKRARRVTVAVLALAAVLGGGWLWVRDSSLVAVEHVTVTGADGPDAAQIRGALVSAARTMSTLDAHLDRLRTAVAPYPVVRDIRVTTQFPHGMRIRVVEEIPVAIVMVNGRPVPVAGDGILLHDAGSAPTLPVLTLSAPPGGPRLTEPLARSAVALLAAAPYPVLAKLSQVSHDAAHGLTAQLRGGPAIYFGDGTEARAKWRAALEVLADPGSAGATYIDVTDPRRPAAGAGGGGSAASAGGSTLSAGASTMSAAASAASAGGAAASTVGGAGASAAGSTTGAGAASTPTQSTGTAAAPASSTGG